MGRRTTLRASLVRSYVLLAVCIMIVFTAGTGLVLFAEMRTQAEHFAIQDIETVEGLLAFDANGRIVVREDYHNHPESKKVVDHYVEVLSPSGEVIYRNDRLGDLRLGGSPLPDEGVGGYSPRHTSLEDGTPIVLVGRRHVLEGHPLLIRLGLSEEPARRAVEIFLMAAALMFPLVGGAAGLVAHRMSGRILAPVENIATRASRIQSSNLNERLPVHGTGDEIDRLAEVFNETLSRLEKSFRQLRQFTSDASHELRTPLAAVRAIGEAGLERDRTGPEYREMVGSMLEEVGRLTRLVNDLLMISRGDAGSIRLNRGEVRVMQMVRDTVALLEPLAEEKSQALEISGGEDAVVRGDAVFLRQALINVVDNAIKYSPAGATTRVRVDGGERVEVRVTDQGPGIAAEHIPHIFDRFYRADSGRSRDAGGFGLGLAIAAWAIEAHRGSISVSSEPGKGSTFRISLPGLETGA
ncbi:MAG: HAMP domain-containing protein [Acidobacteriota bacterium]|nr:HAMP domain-containing protein [Acidobacteriota bacterium]